MVNFTPEDVTRRTAEAAYKKELSSITGVREFKEKARLDEHYAALMEKVINDHEGNVHVYRHQSYSFTFIIHFNFWYFKKLLGVL